MSVVLPFRREVDLLILGAGWTSTFLIPLLRESSITFAATTTTGRDSSIKFAFDPDSDDEKPYEALPRAKTILITFPLKGTGQSKKLTNMYWRTHDAISSNWIQLGSTGIFPGDGWQDNDSPYDKTNPRAIAEQELIELGSGCVLNLAGLYGETRDPKNWVSRVAKSKDQVRGKTSLHLIHGDDVAAAIVAVHKRFHPGERWILTDRHVYDWWDLINAWGGDIEASFQPQKPDDEVPAYRRWVAECMKEADVRALPRDTSSLGRLLDSRLFWDKHDILPNRRLDR